MNLLIVDDHATNRNLLRAQLEAEGHNVLEASDGVQALAMLEHAQYVDGVISDILMPNMDGYRLCQEIRRHARLRDLPIIIYTSSFTSPADAKLALGAGADKYLTRPASVETLVAALHEAIAIPHAARQPKALQEVEVLKEYNERLVFKLEGKALQLEQNNRDLAAREARLHAIFENGPECVKLLAADGSLLEMNPAGLQMIEADSLQQVANRCLYPLVVEEHRNTFRELTEKVFRGESGTLKFQITGLKGGRRWLETHATPLRDERGEVTALLGIMRDITEHKRAEESLLQSEERYRLLFERSPDTIFALTPTGTIAAINHAFETLTGWPPVQWLGRAYQEIIHPDDQTRAGELFQLLLRGERAPTFELRVATASGEFRDVEFTGFSSQLSGGLIEVQGIGRDITERRRAEVAAQRSQKRLRDLIDGLGPSMFVGLMTPQGILIEANRPALAAAGLKPEDVLGKPFEETYWWAYSQEVQQQLREAIARVARGEASRYDVQVRAAENHLIDIDFSLQPLRDETGEVVFLVPSANVITERKQTENALRASEEKFRGLFENSRDAIMTLESPSWSFASGNPATVKMFGAKNEDEFISLKPWELSPEQQPDGRPSADQAREMIETALREGSHFFEWTHRRIGGEEFPANVLLTRMEQGKKVILQATVRDITKQKQTEAEIRNLNAELEQRVAERTQALEFERRRHSLLLNSAGEGLYGLDLEGRIIFINPAGARIVGHTVEELLGQPMHTKCHHTYADGRPFQREECPIYAALHDGQAHHHSDDVMWRKDGSMVPIEYTSTPIRDEDGRLTGAMVVFSDITDRKRYEAELGAAKAAAESANRAKSEFLASMSHELRTPLNGILGMNELLMNTELTERQRQFVEACSTSGKALLQQINDILDLSKIEAGKLELDLHECNLEALMYDIADVFSHSAQRKGYPLHCHFDPAACIKVMCDDNRIRQILVNLLGNAMKFTTAGAVTLRAECLNWFDGQLTLRFSITDTGVGIPEDRRNRLFEPFSQVDSSTSRKFGGTGLGLSICKQLVELMGGQIGVESQLGVGSTFWFEVALPLVAEDSVVGKRRHMVVGQRVLVVDSDQRQIMDCLQTWGCRAERVATVQNALEAVARTEATGVPFTAVLADYRLAVGDEYVLLQKLAKDSRLPIIGLGTNPDDETIAYLRQLGVRHVLRDPVRPSMLFNALTAVLAITSPTAFANQKPDAAADKQATKFSGHILVAEDNHINQMFIRELLTYCGCTCDVANNGDEALRALQQNRYDLILMDCQMPEMDGFTASREIRRREAAGALPGRLPIIALTANALKGDREQCLDAGMDDYVSKPVEGEQLRAVLEKFLSRTSRPQHTTGEGI